MTSKPKPPLNVIWIVADTLRADRMGCYGYFRDTSPTLDRLAREGTLFEDFYCSGLSTGAAFSCLFSGLPSIRHRFYATPASARNIMNFDDSIPTLPEIIQSNCDCTTVAVDNLLNFGGHMKQTARGFEFYINVTRDGGFTQPEYTAGEANARFLPWLDTFGKEPFFAFLHLWDVHHNPYRAPGFRDRFKHEFGAVEGLPVREAAAGYSYVPAWGKVGEIAWGIYGDSLVRDVDGGAAMSSFVEPSAESSFAEQCCERRSRNEPVSESGITQDLYDCSVAYLDSQIARIIEALERNGTLDSTAIVLTADHGEGLGNHGIWGHGLLYEDTVHIPLIIWRPGLIPQGKRVKGFAQHVDIAPTILDLMGIARPGTALTSRIGAYSDPETAAVEVSMEGRSLLPRISGLESAPESIVTEVRRGPGDPGLRSIKTGNWKLIESLASARELYNLTDDPMEKINLAEQDAARADEMSAQLVQWVKAHVKEGEPDPMRVWG